MKDLAEGMLLYSISNDSTNATVVTWRIVKSHDNWCHILEDGLDDEPLAITADQIAHSPIPSDWGGIGLRSMHFTTIQIAIWGGQAWFDQERMYCQRQADQYANHIKQLDEIGEEEVGDG